MDHVDKSERIAAHVHKSEKSLLTTMNRKDWWLIVCEQEKGECILVEPATITMLNISAEKYFWAWFLMKWITNDCHADTSFFV